MHSPERCSLMFIRDRSSAFKEVLGLDPLPEEIPFELGATGKELEE